MKQTQWRRLKRERERKIAKSDTFLLDTIYVVDPFSRCFFMSFAFRSNKTKQARPENESPSFFLFIASRKHTRFIPMTKWFRAIAVVVVVIVVVSIAVEWHSNALFYFIMHFDFNQK